MNSASCGGAPNVSDTFASTLWVLDFLPELSKAKVVGVNFHGGPVDLYSPVSYSTDGQLTFVSPLYIGLLAFSELVANSSRWAMAEVRKSAALKDSFAHAALAVQEEEGRGVCTVLRVLVIAKDGPDGGVAAAGEGVAVTVKVPASLLARPESTATLLRLTAPALASKTGLRWAGQGFGPGPPGVLSALGVSHSKYV